MKYLLLALLITQLVTADSVFIAELISEGARSPHGENIFKGRFPHGPNEITSLGLRQHYLVGYDLRTNYADALGLDKTYSPWQVNIRSTNHNMTLMGAQAQLEAIFPPDARGDLRPEQAALAIPPGETDSIKDDIKKLGNKIMPKNFQTLPIHSFDFDKDTVLMGQWCNKIYETNQKVVSDESWIAEIEEKYKDDLTAFRTFLKNDNLSIHEIYAHIDTLNATIFNLDSVNDLKANEKNLLAFGFEYLEKYWSNTESLRIYSNGFFTDLQRYLEDSKKQYEDQEIDNYNQMKLSLYFGTLESVYVISRQLGVNHTSLPAFSSQLLFHVTKEAESGFMIEATYNKIPVKLGGDCKDQESCELSSFVSFVNTLTADASELSGCEPAEPLMFMADQGQQFENTETLEFILLMSILAFFALLIGGLLGHRAAQIENKKRRIKVNVFDQEALLSN